MDFVVAGLGFGALLIVIGFAVRDIGPLIWKAPESLTDEAQARSSRRLAQCRTVANALAVAGCVTLAGTIIAVLFNVSDSVGEIVVASTAIVGLAAAGVMIVRSLRVTGETAQPDSEHANGSQPQDVIPNDVQSEAVAPSIPVQPVPQPEIATAVQANDEPAAVAEDFEEIEEFDPNKLLAMEFDGHHDSSAELPLFGELAPASLPNPAEVDSVQPALDVEFQPDHVEDPPPEEHAEDIPMAESVEAASTGFESPLFADISEVSPPDSGERQFSSSLLADLSLDDATDSFRSPLLADVSGAPRSESEQTDTVKSDSVANGTEPEPSIEEQSSQEQESIESAPIRSIRPR